MKKKERINKSLEIFFNIEKLLKFQNFCKKMNIAKYIFSFYFKNLHSLLNTLNNNQNIFGLLDLFYEILENFSKNISLSSLYKYTKLRYSHLSYLIKKKNIQKKISSLVQFNNSLRTYQINSKIHFHKKLDSKFGFFFVSILGLKFKKLKVFEIKKNFSDLNFLDNYLYSYQKFITLLDVALFWISIKNFRFTFFIGTTQLFRIIFSNLTAFNLLDFDFKNEILFDFFTYKKKSPKNMKLYIKSERYRFWKNINTHSFFVCPVEKVPSQDDTWILSCGHVFSQGTIVDLYEYFLDHRIDPTRYYFLKFWQRKYNLSLPTITLECPWCEMIKSHSIANSLLFHFSK